VIGAASLAGFSPAVIARATQRCSNLFEQDMAIHTLLEQPVATGGFAESMQTVIYTPGAPPIPSPDEDKDEDELEIEQLRTVSRQSSAKLTGPSSPEPSRTTSAIGTPKRRRSATPGVGGELHFCPHIDCPRALEGFTRRANLARHLERTHGKSNVQATTGDEDSMDEVDGGVHVDGFLQPIKLRQGWRGEDLARRKRQGGSRYQRPRRGDSMDGSSSDDGRQEQDLSSSN
jgi:hypothetical protein